MNVIRTSRLELVAADAASTHVALAGRDALSRTLGVDVPATWPPEHVDEGALTFMCDRLAAGADQAGWWLYFVVARDGGDCPVLVGTAGFKGPPTEDGTVEVGYSVLPDHRRRGYASEAVSGLVEHAFSFRSVRRVIAETLPELVGSIGVLEKTGFRAVDGASEPGVLRFERAR